MEVGDPVAVSFKEGYRISAAVGVVADVETQRHLVRVGVREETLDLFLVFDVGLGVGVEDELQSE